MRTIYLFFKFLFRKNKVQCPICWSEYPEYGPFGLSPYKNRMCYKCGSLERHRLIWLFMKDQYNALEYGTSLLHFAPEKIFRDIFHNSKKVGYYPCDLHPENFNFHVFKQDITQINYPGGDECFDVILCSDVLEHIPDDRKAMRELFRMLKPGGFAIIHVPLDLNNPTYEDFTITDPAERKKHFWQEDHVRVCGNDYGSRLMDAGFKVQNIDYKYNFSPDGRKLYGIENTHYLFYCTK